MKTDYSKTKHPCRWSGLDRAFTLIELLVVIAIIAMLFSLLLPGLRGAKFRAQVSACKSNLRQVAAGLNVYAADNDGMYPKNGAGRQWAQQVRAGNYFDIEKVMTPYFGTLEVMGCPLVAPRLPEGTVPWGGGSDRYVTYQLLFDTWSGNNVGGSIARHPTQRVYQYDLDGNVIADETSWSAMQTWWWPKLDESGLMRRVGQTWTLGTGPRKFRVLACDRVDPKGSPFYGVIANHPDPAKVWEEQDGYNGLKAWITKYPLNESGGYIIPAASGNFAATDGSVRLFQRDQTRYWPPVAGPWTSVGGVGIVPNFFEQ